jgi:hypothetical protein
MHHRITLRRAAAATMRSERGYTMGNQSEAEQEEEVWKELKMGAHKEQEGGV